MNESNTNAAISEFKDRSTGLLVFGILDIVLAAGCLLMIALMILGQVISARTTGMAQSLRMVAFAAGIYGGLAVALAWLGIGSINRRRWARALLLILSWSWLVMGILSEGMMVFLLPRILSTGQTGGQETPPGFVLGMMIIVMLFTGVLFIAVPGVMTFFYGSRHAKATCEARNPRPSWTDACPLPVLGVACWLWVGGVSILLMPVAYGGVVPFFGTLVTGLPGVTLIVAFAVLCLWLGWNFYRLNPAGWWILLGFLIVVAISNTITFTRIDLIEMYQKMGYPEAQLELLRKQEWMTNRLFAWWTVLFMVPLLGYLVWVKRFFNRSQSTGEDSAQPAA
jgi:hypothetical protein